MAEKFDLSVVLSFITKGDKNMQNFSNNMKGLGKSMMGIGKTMSLAVTAPIIGFGVNAVRIGTDFQRTMNMVGAVTNTTGKEFKALNNQAKFLGRTTQFSARQAAEAMKFMGMAGMDANTIIGASPKVLQLAAAAQLDMASAADIVTNIMAGFGFQTKELTEVNNILVDTFTNANVSLPQMGEALKKVGPMAKALKVPFEQVAAALGVLGNAGIQGEEAGTGLKTMFSRLLNPSKAARKVMENLNLQFRNADGTIKNVTGIVQEFEKALVNGADETVLMQGAVEIFGQRGIQIISALVSQGSSELDKLVAKLGIKDKNGLGSAVRIAQRQMEGLPGAIALLKSTWEGLNIALTEGKLGEVVNNLARELANLLSKVTAWAEKNPKIVEGLLKLAGVVAVSGPLLLGLGAMAVVIGALISPIGLVVVGITSLVAGIAYLYFRFDEFLKLMDNPLFKTTMLFFAPFIAIPVIIIRAWQQAKVFFIDLWESIKNIGLIAWGTLVNSFNDSVIAIKKVGVEIKEYWITIFEEIALWFSNFWNVTIPNVINNSITGIKETATNAISGILPDFIENRIMGSRDAIAGGMNQSNSEVTIKVQAADGTTAMVENVKQTGSTKTNVQNDFNVGNILPGFIF